MNYLIYDLEIKKGPLGRRESPEPGIEYCQGWTDHGGMGVSCLCAYDSLERRYRVFFEDNRAEFEDLATSRDLLVGFNSIRFDDKVLEAESWLRGGPKRYDILREIWISQGLDPDSFGYHHNGFGLDACATAEGLGGKTGHGAQAPKDWQRGRYGSLVDYCLEDVRLTRNLFHLILSEGGFRNPKTGGYMKLRHPLEAAE